MNTTQLLVDCRADRFSANTQSLLRAIATDIVSLGDKYTGLNDEYVDIVESLGNLGYLLADLAHPSPNLYFNLEGFGHYKECYTFSPNLVIKFCAKRSPTDEEQDLYDKARSNSLGFLFIPSFYYELPHSLESNELEKEEGSVEIYDENDDEWVPDPDWHDNTDFTTICIQLRCITADQLFADSEREESDEIVGPYNELSWQRTVQFLGLSEDTPPHDYYGLSGTCLPWAKTFIEHYGVTYLEIFSRFCEANRVFDLHSGNVGFTIGDVDGASRPVLLDWLSR